jgi:hypothetical protein
VGRRDFSRDLKSLGPQFGVIGSWREVGPRPVNLGSASLDIKEMQIKSTLTFHLTPVRMAVIKGNNKCRRRCGETGILAPAGGNAS